MGVMIIRPDGTTETTETTEGLPSANEEALKRPTIEMPHLEERPMVEEENPQSNREDTQAIIARILGNPLA
ncbi:hypothetical protein GF369_03045 [Candidatus Peregrinibacteria bacterium]|nr:hypothetical protein [Candidatus Peregrinibacteria bacterium]